MKTIFNSARRKFFGLLAGAAALPLAAQALPKVPEPQEPAAEQKQKNDNLGFTMSGRVGIGIATPSAVFHVR